MKNTLSLKENRVFRQLYGKGRSFVTPLFVLYYRENRLGKNRLGITVGKKLGSAVMRNRAKRLIREAYRLSENNVRVGYDFVFVCRTKTPLSNCQAVRDCLDTALSKTGLSVTERDNA